MIPFKAESDKQLRDRFQEAIDFTWDARHIQDNPVEADRPGLHRKHVFDFRTGWRLIISKERLPTWEVVLHFSTSYIHKHPAGYTDKDIVEESVLYWYNVSQMFEIMPEFIGFSTKGIPHFLVHIKDQ